MGLWGGQDGKGLWALLTMVSLAGIYSTEIHLTATHCPLWGPVLWPHWPALTGRRHICRVSVFQDLVLTLPELSSLFLLLLHFCCQFDVSYFLVVAGEGDGIWTFFLHNRKKFLLITKIGM